MSMKMGKVTGLRGVMLETPELDSCAQFYADVWGIEPVGATQGQTRHFRARGPEAWVLGLTAGAQRGLMALRLAAASAQDLDAIYTRLVQAGVRVLSAPGPLDGPGHYHGFLCKDPDGRTVEISVSDATSQPTALAAPAPIRASHVVLNSPQARAVATFYVQHFGFEISDWYEKDAIIFLRCNDDHHCLGIGQGSNAALNHIAFLVDDGDAVQAASRQVQRLGCEAVWGPGRHGPGGNVFCYFKDPVGYVVEYTAELIQIADGAPWQAQEWVRNAANANTWGTGGPTPLAIQLMNGD
jgi:catechol 2,3-dioxygenase-like lactoylglutathione lyase family enzyme